MSYQTLNVDLDDRSYPIYIGSQILTNADLLKKHVRSQQVMVVTNETIAPIYLDTLLQSLQGLQVDTVILPDGEQYKTLDTVNQIFTALIEKRHSRQTCLIALGGGVIGDMTGFAAASYQRGVDFIQIPTTLLSQVDSSVGGKTGVNHQQGKNMIGAFKQPKAVLIDIDTLNTLPKRELSAGIAEVIKYGLIRDTAFFNWLEEHVLAMHQLDANALQYAIEQSCACKAKVVAEDELEQGVRALLNLGHTFGHAIEACMGYGHYLHGEAVAIGTVMASYLSLLQGDIDATAHQRIIDIFEKVQLPVTSPETMTVDDFMDKMAIDKKVQSGQIRLILLKSIGEASLTSDFSVELFQQTLATKCFS